MDMTIALLIGFTFAGLAFALLFLWPAYARGGYTSVAQWWRQPDQKVLVAGLVACVAAPIALASGPLVAGEPMVHSTQVELFQA